MNLLEQISPLVNLINQPCDTESCLTSLEREFYRASCALGFPHARFSVISDRASPSRQQILQRDSREPRHAESRTDSLMFSINFDSFPAEFTQHYVAGQLWRFDNLLILVQRTLRSTLFTCWHTAAQQFDLVEQHPAIATLARRLDINSGVLLSYWNGERQTIVSLGCNDSVEQLTQRVTAEQLEQRIMTVTLAVNAVIDKISACQRCVVHARKPRVANIQLTRAQKKILQAYLNDPSASLLSISENQGISCDTVKYHLKCVRDKLTLPGASGHVLAHAARQISLL